MSSGGTPRRSSAATTPTANHRTGRKLTTQNGSTAALLLTLPTTSLTTKGITLLTLLIRRNTLSQPLRNKLRITRKPIQLNRILTRARIRVLEHRLTHPITLLMQHPIRHIHPQPTPRPRTTTRNSLRTTKLTKRQFRAVRRYNPPRHTINSQLRIKLTIKPDPVDSYFDTASTLLENPTPYRLFGFIKDRLYRLQLTRHSTLSLRRYSPILKCLRSSCQSIGVLRGHCPLRRNPIIGIHVA